MEISLQKAILVIVEFGVVPSRVTTSKLLCPTLISQALSFVMLMPRNGFLFVVRWLVGRGKEQNAGT